MKNFWDRLFGLDDDLSTWVEEADLGREILISHRKRISHVKIPKEIDKQITLRLVGLGKKSINKTVDLFLHLWLNKGEDIRKSLWLSETSARNGGEKILSIDGKRIVVVIPPKSYHGLTIRLKGLGTETHVDPCAPALYNKAKGNMLVKLFVYPDRITPQYGEFDLLSTENMFLEGWVYRKFDEVINKLGKSSFPTHPIQASVTADLFNEGGWTSIFYALVRHLNLAHLIIEITTSASISLPGCCEKTATVQYYPSAYNTAIVPSNNRVTYTYKVTINEQFLDNPFSIAAILAHELCHIVYSEKIVDAHTSVGDVIKSEKTTLEDEHMVDLLVFMFKMGEFQLRVARDKRLTFGYFNQEVFERIQVIVSRKLDSF
jgi:hypothetical protein